jgi:hypothetical protein
MRSEQFLQMSALNFSLFRAGPQLRNISTIDICIPKYTIPSRTFVAHQEQLLGRMARRRMYRGAITAGIQG